MKIYILGVSGMLGSKLFEKFLNSKHRVRVQCELYLRILSDIRRI